MKQLLFLIPPALGGKIMVPECKNASSLKNDTDMKNRVMCQVDHGEGRDDFEFHYGYNATTKTLAVCAVNKDDTWLGLGVGEMMVEGAFAVISWGDAEPKAYGFMGNKTIDNGTTKLNQTNVEATVIDGKRRLCFTLPRESLVEDSDNLWHFLFAAGNSTKKDKSTEHRTYQKMRLHLTEQKILDTSVASTLGISTLTLIAIIAGVAGTAILLLVFFCCLGFMVDRKKKPPPPAAAAPKKHQQQQFQPHKNIRTGVQKRKQVP